MPPPIHGAVMIGKYIHDSKSINDTFETVYSFCFILFVLVRMKV